MGNVYRSNYNGLQVTLNARNYHGLSMVAGYTYAHALDDVGANWDFGYGSGLPQNAHNLGAEYANSDFDIRQRLTVSLTYAIPGRERLRSNAGRLGGKFDHHAGKPAVLGPDGRRNGRGRRWAPSGEPAGQYSDSLEFLRQDFGLQVSEAELVFRTTPARPNSRVCRAGAGVDGGAAGASTASLNLLAATRKGNSVMIPPPLGQFGNMSRNMFQDSGFKNFDFSLAKNFHFGETMRLQFRAEFFNILNHPNFANPYGGQNGFGLNDPSVRPFGCGCATPDIAAANPAVGSGGPRSIQLGAKFIF